MEYNPPTALVVDDAPEFRALLSALLRQLGLTVHVAPDGETVLLAGKDTVWALRSTLARLTAPTEEF